MRLPRNDVEYPTSGDGRLVREDLDHDAAATELGDRLSLLGGIAAEHADVRHDDDVPALEAPEESSEAFFPGLGDVGRGMTEALDGNAEARELAPLLDDRRHPVASDDDADEPCVRWARSPDLVPRGDFFDVLAHTSILPHRGRDPQAHPVGAADDAVAETGIR